MSSLNKSDVELIVKKSTQTSSEVVHYREEPYSEKVCGYMGYHGRLEVEVSSGSKYSYFVKKMPQSNAMLANFMESNGAFRAEQRFYSEIFPVLQSSLQSKIPKMAPNAFLSRSDLIVMEDLKFLGFTAKTIPLDLDHVKAALATLARFHCAAILTEERLGKIMLELFPGAFEERVLFCEQENFFDPGVNAIAGAAEKLGLAKYQTVHDICQKLRELVKPSRDHRNVVSQADTWAYNLLFRRNDSEELECVLVDYQLIRYVPMVLDVSQCLYVNLERAQRQVHERELLRFYYEELDRFAQENGCKGIPSFQQILSAYEDTRLYGAIYAGLLLPVALMDDMIKENELNNAEGFNKFAFQGRSQVIFRCMDEQEAYRLKIGEIVSDILEAGRKTKKSEE